MAQDPISRIMTPKLLLKSMWKVVMEVDRSSLREKISKGIKRFILTLNEQ